MSNVTDYNEVCKSYDTGRKAADAHVIKSLMENFTGKDVKVVAFQIYYFYNRQIYMKYKFGL